MKDHVVAELCLGSRSHLDVWYVLMPRFSANYAPCLKTSIRTPSRREHRLSVVRAAFTICWVLADTWYLGRREDIEKRQLSCVEPITGNVVRAALRRPLVGGRRTHFLHHPDSEYIFLFFCVAKHEAHVLCREPVTPSRSASRYNLWPVVSSPCWCYDTTATQLTTQHNRRATARASGYLRLSSVVLNMSSRLALDTFFTPFPSSLCTFLSMYLSVLVSCNRDRLRLWESYAGCFTPTPSTIKTTPEDWLTLPKGATGRH